MISFKQEVTTMKSLAEARIKRTRAVELIDRLDHHLTKVWSKVEEGD